MKPTLDEILGAKEVTSYKELAEKTDSLSQNYLVGIEAVKACKRPNQPLIWFRSDRAYVCHEKENIKEWMRGNDRHFKNRDLITDRYCVPGYEANFVIYLGSSDNISAYMSRCRSQFVHIE